MSKKEFDVKTDCFAYRNGHCIALKELYCVKEECSFYKPMKDVLNDKFVPKIKIKED